MNALALCDNHRNVEVHGRPWRMLVFGSLIEKHGARQKSITDHLSTCNNTETPTQVNARASGAAPTLCCGMQCSAA